MGYIQTRAPAPLMRHLPTPADKMAQVRIDRTNRAMANLTQAQRAAFPNLTFSQRLYVIEHGGKKWPPSAPLPKEDRQPPKRERPSRAVSKRALLTVDMIIKDLDRAEMTVTDLHDLYVNGKGSDKQAFAWNTIRKKCQAGVREGLLKSRKNMGENAIYYSVAK